jgi:hypothetical protein
LVADTTVAIISCWRRSSGSSGAISEPKVAKAWYSASGIREWADTMPTASSTSGGTGVAYSGGYRACWASRAMRSASSASASGIVLMRVIVGLRSRRPR